METRHFDERCELQLHLTSLLRDTFLLSKLENKNTYSCFSTFVASSNQYKIINSNCKTLALVAFVVKLRGFTISTWRHGLHVFGKLAADAIIVGADVMETPSG